MYKLAPPPFDGREVEVVVVLTFELELEVVVWLSDVGACVVETRTLSWFEEAVFVAPKPPPFGAALNAGCE